MSETPNEPNSGAHPNGGWASGLLSKFARSAKWTSVVGLLAAAGVFLFFVRPWEIPQELPEDNTALAWNAAIERLGIQPLYPPQEDFLVGDIYISLSDPETEIAGQKVRFPSNVFRGRSVRIARIDLRNSIRNGIGPYRFAGTQAVDSQAGGAPENLESSTGSKTSDSIDLTLVSFPGLSVKNHTRAEAGFWGYFAGRRMGETKEILIKSTATYGAPAIEAMAALQNFCVDKKTSPACNDDAARRILGYTFGPEVRATYKDQYIFPIKISIVSQVFLTRELKVSRYRGDVLDLTGKQDGSEADGSSSETKSQAPDHDIAAGPANDARYKNMHANRMELNESFSRPLAFGFRSISFAFPRSNPPAASSGGPMR